MDQTLREWPANSVVVLKNLRCVYCGTWFDTLKPTKEHVIGRRFVPKGKLNGQWNLIVQACKACNRRKSDLENDISGITLFPDQWGKHADPEDVDALESSRRKATNCISAITGLPIKDSIPRFTIKVPLAPGATLTFNMTANPELSEDRVYELARLHCMAFFFFVTYDAGKKVGGYWLGEFLPLMETVRADWGNPVMRTFAEAVVNWEPRVYAVTADGFFKIVIRRHPEAVCWSWALEWNKTRRVIGFFGDVETAQVIASSFPKIEMNALKEHPNKYMRFRLDVPITEEEDVLFEGP